jgi:hypothetical protein
MSNNGCTREAPIKNDDSKTSEKFERQEEGLI